MHTLLLALSLTLVPQPREMSVGTGVRSCSSEEIARAVASFTRDAAIPDEGYRLVVDEAGVRISASSAAGAFYAGQTLRQLRDAKGTVPRLRISDAPKFPWRGVMLDEARHFFGKAEVLKLLETMAQFKLNVLHWHLTDDQGWRLPIPGIPELTRGVRVADNRINFRDVKTGLVGPEAYTRAELEEIVARAKALHIRIVPEVDVPGHSKAVLRIFGEYNCFFPWGPKDMADNAVCPGKDEVVRFYERVFDELCDIFPGEVVHIGGDECDRRNWKTCPKCAARMQQEGLKDVAELQAWVTDHFCKYLAAKGRRLLGWDEIAEGGLPASAMVMSWRGTSTGIVAAQAGHDVVMTPNEYCYFDYEQCVADDPVVYPYNWTVPVPLAKVYAFDPARGIPSAFRKHVLGAQCNNWTEMTCTGAELEWKLWPRAAALAEVLWSYPEKRDFAAFSARLVPLRERLVAEGVNAAPVALTPAPGARGTLVREKRADGEEIRYSCGATEARLVLAGGRLELFVNGKSVKKFQDEKKGKRPFVEFETIETGPSSYLTTARRRGSEIVATVRFESEQVIAKERWDYRPDPLAPLDVQKLVDDAAAKGGGEAYVPAGRWEVKPFVMKSNVTLRLDDRAMIFASGNPDDYVKDPLRRAFIFSEGAENIAIVGRGSINGRGSKFRELRSLPGESQPQSLPVMIRLSTSRNVRLEDFTYYDCGAWGCHLRNCDGVTVRRIKCHSHVNNTNDGLDIESSNVLVEDCDIDSNDDALCFKTESDKTFPVTNVVVRNCRLASCCNAIKFGTGTYCDMRGITIENCRLGRASANHGFQWHKSNPGVTNRICGIAGFAIEVVDGGRLDGLTIRNVEMEGYAVPVFVREQRRHEPAPGKETYLRNVLVENVKAVADSRIASSITGVPGRRPRGITLRNVDILCPGGGTEEDAKRPVPELEKGYPDAHMFGHKALPAWGFYVRHADDVRFENVTLRLAAPDARRKFVFDDCTGCAESAAAQERAQ